MQQGKVRKIVDVIPNLIIIYGNALENIILLIL